MKFDLSTFKNLIGIPRGPLLLTIFLIVWTAAVFRFSGALWAVMPAFLVLPAVIVIYIMRVLRGHRSSDELMYAFLHIGVLSLLWWASITILAVHR